jgi:hypothetical protein
MSNAFVDCVGGALHRPVSALLLKVEDESRFSISQEVCFKISHPRSIIYNLLAKKVNLHSSGGKKTDSLIPVTDLNAHRRTIHYVHTFVGPVFLSMLSDPFFFASPLLGKFVLPVFHRRGATNAVVLMYGEEIVSFESFIGHSEIVVK